jgi:tetratricopeptide (TPR) repeat protein
MAFLFYISGLLDCPLVREVCARRRTGSRRRLPAHPTADARSENQPELPVFGQAGSTLLVALLAISGLLGCATFSRKKIDPDVVSGRQLSLQGMDAMRRGRLDEASSLLGQATDLCPMDERMRCHYAQTLWDLGQQEKAIEHMEQAVQLSGGDAELLVLLGDMYFARGDLSGASRQADMAIARNRQLACAWALRGDVLRRQDREDQALADYHRALSFQRSYPRVQMAVAEIYRAQCRYMRALATLRCLADGYAGNDRPQGVLFLEGLVLKDLGRYEEAVQSLSAAAKSGQPSRELLYHFAEAQMLAGDAGNARLTAEQGLATVPRSDSEVALETQFQALQQRLGTTIRR